MTPSVLSCAVVIGSIGGAIYYLFYGKGIDTVSKFIQESPLGLMHIRQKLCVTKEDKKLGMKFSYDPTQCVLHREIRVFPVAFYELRILSEPDASILVVVEEFSHKITLEEHKIYTFNAIAMHLNHAHIDKENNKARLGGRASVELEYGYSAENDSPHRAWCAMAVQDNRAYSVHGYFPESCAARAKSIICHIAKSVKIYEESQPESYLYFTEPRFGLGIRLPPSYNVEYESIQENKAIVSFEKADTTSNDSHERDSKPVMRLDHISSLYPDKLDAGTLEVAVTTVRGILENSVGKNERLEWKTGTILDESALACLKTSIGPGSFEYQFISPLSSLPGKFFFHDVTTHFNDGMIQKTERYVTFVLLTAYGVFRFTACSSPDEFSNMFVEAERCLENLSFHNQHGQTCSLIYRHERYQFSIRIPTHFQVHETQVADPIVMFTPGEFTSDSPAGSGKAMYTIDVSAQILAEDDQLETCIEGYHDFLKDSENVSSIKFNDTIIGTHAGTEFSFIESYEENVTRVVVVLMVHSNTQFLLQLTTTEAEIDEGYQEFRKIIETIQFQS